MNEVKPMNLSALTGIIATLIGAFYTLTAFGFKDASIGNPLAPKIMPLGLGVLMMVFGILLTLIELKKGGLIKAGQPLIKDPETLRVTALLSAACILYAVIFEKAGYVISTIIFLELVMFVFGGFKDWKLNTVVAVCFSVSVYVVFSKLLGITLPVMPFLYI